MKRFLTKGLLFLFPLLFMGACNKHLMPPESTLVFARGDEGSKFYRIPALVTAADGSLVAVADKRIETMGDLPSRIDIVARRSEDGGRTWSETIPVVRHRGDYGYGDPALVVDRRTGELLCIFAAGAGMWTSTPEQPTDIGISRSRDHGRTWSEPERITASIYGAECPDSVSRNWFAAFAASGRALQLRDGTLMFAIAVREGEPFPPLSNYVVVSSDAGRSWQLLPTPVDKDGDEAKLVELADGSWLMSIRNPAKGHRKFAVSHDRGATWSQPQEWRDVRDPACNGDIMRYTLADDGFSRNRLLLSTPYDKRERRRVSVLMSYDEGRTWPVRKTVWRGAAGYSSLTVLPDGTIGLLTEVGGWKAGFDIYFTRITPDWLTDGKDAYL